MRYELQNYEIGYFILQAKLDYVANHGLRDHAEMYTLFGDPALSLNVINEEAPIVELRVADQSLVMDEQYVSKNPVFTAIITANNPISSELTEIILDDLALDINDPAVDYFPYEKNRAELMLKTSFEQGRHSLRVIISDSSGLKGEDRIAFTVQENEFYMKNVLNYPNPMIDETYFTYGLSQPADITIKIYTVSGRLIQELHDYSVRPFSSVYWDGRDWVGDRIANGVYLYKVIAKSDKIMVSAIERLLKIE